MPYSWQFWQQYAEPIGAFFQATETLKLELLGSMKSIAALTASERKQLGAKLDALHGLVTPACPTLYPNRDGSFAQRWIASSLLGAFATMALLDRGEEDRRLLRCICGRLRDG